jgi:uncharacterized phosphosugar-binding protein
MSGEQQHPFFQSIRQILGQVEMTQLPALRQAAAVTADRLIAGGMLHIFGTGHSHMLAEEIFYRAGGLVQINAILDPGLMLHVSALHSTDLERLEGYAAVVLDRYDLRAQDVLVVVSNSGRNAAPIDAALYAKARGLYLIAVTSAAANRDVLVRHSGGERLADIVDIVIDTCIPPGDALMRLDALPNALCAASTIIGATVMQSFVYETVKAMVARSSPPRVLASANVDGAEYSDSPFGEYVARIRHL